METFLFIINNRPTEGKSDGSENHFISSCEKRLFSFPDAFTEYWFRLMAYLQNTFF